MQVTRADESTVVDKDQVVAVFDRMTVECLKEGMTVLLKKNTPFSNNKSPLGQNLFVWCSSISTECENSKPIKG